MQTGTDIAVLIIFFTRTEMLRRTFEAIRKARPSHILLYQDGPRNEDDAHKAEAARQVVDDEAIDWECDLHRNYHTENAGLWPSTYNAMRWAFSLYDKCVILEEDSTPAPSFIPFCKELLDRYATMHFQMPDGTFNLTVVGTYTTDLMLQHGLQLAGGVQPVAEQRSPVAVE